MFRIQYSKAALRALRKTDAGTAKKIRGKIERLARNPENAPNVIKLSGRTGYRMRVGDWRVLFTVDEEQLVVVVIAVGPRGGIYQ